MSSNSQSAAAGASSGDYVVVARRYRPQTFDELIGQGQATRALEGAITSNRVGHAYLFTGARGVGKTSAARIFAKALNCEKGPTPTPCNECDICQTIAIGEDVDVLEIDGASNRGIDEIRQLRSNVNVRPSRARFKIYIIDEVHMLTTPAFNALLKTLEEPPEHVKFIFCTTDPEKIPITVLSRCQRFDFAPVETDSIIARLQQIVEAEQREADAEALRMLARRANGSMRDSQSLLEQLLSFTTETITADDIHRMLGTAKSGRLQQLAEKLVERDTAGALSEIDISIGEGVDAGQLAEQLLGYFRDMMAAVVGCGADTMLHTDPGDFQDLAESGQRFGLETILAIVQILDTMLTKAKQSTHVRTLLEVALVRICNLEQLDSLPELIQQLSQGGGAMGPPKAAPPTAKSNRPSASQPATGAARTQTAAQKKTESAPRESTPPEGQAAELINFEAENATRIWKQLLSQLEDTAGQAASTCDSLAISAPNKLVVRFKPEYTFDKDRCERPENRQKIEQTLSQITGQAIRVDFELLSGKTPTGPKRRPVASRRQQMRDLEKHPFVQSVVEMFDGEVTDVARRPGESSPK